LHHARVEFLKAFPVFGQSHHVGGEKVSQRLEQVLAVTGVGSEYVTRVNFDFQKKSSVGRDYFMKKGKHISHRRDGLGRVFFHGVSALRETDQKEHAIFHLLSLSTNLS
jgi:hypothetical protein